MLCRGFFMYFIGMVLLVRIMRCFKRDCVCKRIAAALAVVCFGACNSDLSRGDDALKIGDYDRAIVNFSKVLDADPLDRDARYGLALSYFAVAEQKEHLKAPTRALWESAVKEFEILSKVDRSAEIDASYSTSLFYLARALLAENGRENVLPLLNRSVELDSLNFFSYNLKALLLGNMGKSEDAKKIYIYIVTKDSKFASAYVNLGNLYWNAGDVESAWDVWSMGHEALPENEALAHWTHVAEDSLKAKVMSGQL